MSTRAIQFLRQKKVPYDVVTYDHREKGAEFAARATGFPLAATIKTLVVDVGQDRYFFVLMPGDRQVSMKQLAKSLAVKRAAMVDTATAERLTGYLVGGISPFGARRRLPSIIEKRLLDHERVMINAGRRGMMLKMAPADIVAALGCRLCTIARP